MPTTPTMTRRSLLPLLLCAPAGAVFGAGQEAGDPAQAPPANPPGLVGPDGASIELTVRLPVVGNVGQVRQWRYGRIQSVVADGDVDVVIELRDGKGNVGRAWCPKEPLEALARSSNWVEEPRFSPSRKEYVERMVAFDVDDNDRIIAIASLEPLPRDEKRIARAYANR